MMYLTQTRLMDESERAVRDWAISNEEVPSRVCRTLLANVSRYAVWHSRQERHMTGVAAARVRERQVLALRSVGIEQIHNAALVRYLRDGRVTGPARELTLREFHGVADSRDAAIAEHRSYLVAESTQLCVSDILSLVGDQRGLDLLHSYELAYGQYFAMFCDRARALRSGHRYLFESLLPEVRGVAERTRLRILSTQLVPGRPLAVRSNPARASIAKRR